MKKYILLLAVAAAVTSCQKIQAGGNLSVIKIEPGVVRYSDQDAAKPTYVAKPDSLKNVKPKLVEPNLEMKAKSTSAQ
ncbi:hypothetical protein SAMN05421847_0529 [Halpernia humi]|uniref:Uncharacterized protein n=1 Tax=Halpernia humi TaxID=493375 RepID=A0A1H5TQR3_9FLAO|nr:hypothetical protein [Halpernia humi]SEF64347.1 hypothetical protein SAMN05421847_0529 [Halpernia humi]